MQEYVKFDAARNVCDILPDMQNAIDSAISNFSGTAFPAENLFVGMKCYRTDEGEEYICTAVASDGTGTWELAKSGTAEKLKAAVEINEISFDGSKSIYAVPNNVPAHNNFYRGKVLTDSYTLEEILAMVANRDYSDIYAGDIIKATVPAITGTGFTEQEISFLVAEIESHAGHTDTDFDSKGHLCLVPKTALGTSKMHTSNSASYSAGGYLACYMHTTVMPAVQTALESVFGTDHVLTTTENLSSYVSTSVTCRGYAGYTGATIEATATECKCKLMSEIEAVGRPAWGSSSLDDRGGVNHQLAVFRLAPKELNIGEDYWLSAVAYAGRYSLVADDGLVYATSANGVIGVRPRFVIG